MLIPVAVEECVAQYFTRRKYLNENKCEGECALLKRDRDFNLIYRVDN